MKQDRISSGFMTDWVGWRLWDKKTHPKVRFFKRGYFVRFARNRNGFPFARRITLPFFKRIVIE
jgi:hypothetical protein